MHLIKSKSPKLRWLAVAALAFLAVASEAGAITGDHVWSKGFPTGGELAVDGSDHIVTHGAFFGTIDLGGGPMTAVNFLDGDQYLARFDAAGNHLWSVQFSPVGNGASGETVAVDPSGAIYITGKVFGGTSIDYGGGPIAGPQVYIAKFDANGNHLWSAGYGDGTVSAIAAGSSQVVVTGYTNVGVDFGGGTVGTAGGYDIFVAQLTSAGAHSWSAGFGDGVDQAGMAVAIDGSGNVLLSGSMFGTVDFGGGGVSANGLDMFLASFTAGGVHSWSHVFDGVFTPGGGILLSNHDLAAGASGMVAVCGELRGSVDFGGGVMTSAGFSDVYVAVFDAAGTHQWSTVYGAAAGSEYANGVAIDGSDNVLVSGTFAEDTDFGGGTIGFNGGMFDRNAFVGLYDSSGGHLFSSGYGPSATTAENDLDSTGQLVIYGYSGGGVDMGGGSISPSDLFVAKLEGASGPASGTTNTPASTAGALDVFPNPFNPTTTIRYAVDTPRYAAVSVYDVRGRLVQDVVPGRWHEAGTHSVTFEAGASGVYFVTLRAGEIEQTIKAVAVK